MTARGARPGWRLLALAAVALVVLVAVAVGLASVGFPPWPASAGGIFAACFLMVVALTIGAWIREHARRDAVRRHCGALGLEHASAKLLTDWGAAFSPFSHLSELHRGAKGLVWIARDPGGATPLTLLEHVYVISSGHSTKRIRHTVAATACPAAWPDLCITPENLGHRVAALFGRGSIQVESRDFNRKWFVACADETFAAVVLTPEMQGWILANARRETFRIGRGSVVCLQRGGLTPDGIDRLVGLLDGFSGRLAPELAAYEAAPLDASSA